MLTVWQYLSSAYICMAPAENFCQGHRFQLMNMAIILSPHIYLSKSFPCRQIWPACQTKCKVWPAGLPPLMYSSASYLLSPQLRVPPLITHNETFRVHWVLCIGSRYNSFLNSTAHTLGGRHNVTSVTCVISSYLSEERHLDLLYKQTKSLISRLPGKQLPVP